MRTTFAMAAIVLAVSIAQTAMAQRRPATEADALSYIHSAFLTQADPGVMDRVVVLGPELQRALALPASAQGAEVYNALIGLAGQKNPEVRKATPQELAEYGARRGFDRSNGPLYTLEVGDRKFLVQYDLQRINISFVGQLGVSDPAPPSAAGFDTVAMRESPAQMQALNLQWTGQFPLNSAELTAEARAALDSEIVPRLLQAGNIGSVHVSGHADRLGPAEYNQRLSEKRAEALRAYLVEKGVEQSKIELFSYGTTLPAKDCGAEKGRALIECLAPNRRVVLEITAR